MVLQRTLQGVRRKGRQKKRWEDNRSELIGKLRTERNGEKRLPDHL